MNSLRIYGIGRNTDRYISFGADAEDLLHDYDAYEKYVRYCEQAVRKDDRYTHYVGKVREAGYEHCAVLGKITNGGDSVKLEMHHGPIFSMFDYCDIVLKACLKRQEIKDITTFDIADLVLTEHEKDNIQIIMLSKSVHKAAHKNLFLSVDASIGRIDRFIDRWHDGMESEHYEYIERYVKEYERVDGTVDQGLFDTYENLKNFKA